MHLAHIALAAALILSAKGATAQNAQPTTITTAGGSCTIIVAGREDACTGTGIAFTTFSNNRFMMMAGMPNGAVSFAGSRIATPSTNTLLLYVDAFRFGPSNNINSISGTGTCQITARGNPMRWEVVLCNLTDGNGGMALMSFRGNGTPVRMEQMNARR